ncbi:MAG: cell wall bioproteinis glycosyltransferase [Candidatus Saganbacteria bacterium]|uniref:Cell wall bioproteinis glycosyltransferase n=1 Tax=Candidatus Saganbacteria bacterium TaxID=2575572 RepID=A0A833L2I4_UNCSA|nr:MAG: cell wall bioproteinis glycosyltransferase [Candidatus Saganbacteria bacterium]
MDNPGGKYEGGLRTQGYYKENHTEKPLVSIVTTVFNGEKYLEQTIKNIINQSYQNIEYIIIDGDSKDKSIEIIRNHEKRIDYWISGKDKGMYDGINKGLMLAKGDILAYLNSDDLYHQQTVETVVNYLKEHPETALVYGNCDYINSKGEYLYTYQCPSFNWKRFVFHDRSFIPQPTSFWRRKVHEKIGYFDASLRHLGDYDFFVRVGKYFRIEKINKSLAAFRIHDQSISALEEETNVREEIRRVHQRYGVSAGIWVKCLNFISGLQMKLFNLPVMRQKLWKKIIRLKFT